MDLLTVADESDARSTALNALRRVWATSARPARAAQRRSGPGPCGSRR